MVQIFVKYAKDNPESLHKPAAIPALVAFMDAFPCNNTSDSFYKTFSFKDLWNLNLKY